MTSFKPIIIIFGIFFISVSVFSQVFMDADNTGDAYARILSKKYNYEVPDCVHPIRHITESWDTDLRKNIFVFDIHKNIDNDRCLYFDRQRNEIKTDAGSPDSMKASFGETHTYRWKFKLDASFQPSANFTHIHQIKAGDGTIDTDNPLITLTPVKSSPNKLEIRFYPPYQEILDTTVKLLRVNLAPFLGEWIEAYESTKFDSSFHGTYSLQLKRLRDDSLLLNYSNPAISMWRRDITFCRPKYGIYRSLLDSASLRDESVRFADFYLKEGTAFILPSAPSGLSASVVSATQINLSWTDNSYNEGQFRIDRSSNGTTWSYLATAKSGSSTYSDTGLIQLTTYYYRVRAENTYGNSSYSNILAAPQATITATAGSNGSVSPSGGVSVNYGASQHFSIVPSTNYHVDSLIIDGVKIASDTQYTFINVAAYHTIRVTFAINSYLITSSAGANGTIFPTPVINVNYGGNQHISIMPAANYHVDSLIVDGIAMAVDTQYTFINVQSNHTIHAAFGINTNTCQIIATASPNGFIIPEGIVIVNFGSDQGFTFTPDNGCSVDSVIIDGVTQTTVPSYTFTSVQINHTIYVAFKKTTQTFQLSLQGRWNLLSLPVDVENPSKLTLFPTAESDAFAYNAGYIRSDSLVMGVGYWLKFGGIEDVIISGTPRLSDTISVFDGWNMIGALSVPIAAVNISSTVSGMITSQFFEYQNGYHVSDSLRPGFGYWVKVNQQGELILASSAAEQHSKAVRIIPISEFPPLSPVGSQGDPDVQYMPKEFSLIQNYPNPFNPVTTIKYELPSDAQVSLRVFDIIGQEVETLVDEFKHAGFYSVTWNTIDCTSGIYYCRIQTDLFSNSIKMIVIK